MKGGSVPPFFLLMNNNTHKRAELYKQVTKALAKLSKVNNLQVGALITDSEGNVLSVGYNTAPFYTSDPQDLYETTLHAEEVALLTCEVKGYLLVCTHAPCLSCASKIYFHGIKEVWYIHPYKDTKGLEFLNSVGIDTKQYE